MSFRVIALSGPAGCGKDTAAHHLKNHFGFGVYAFAAPLKAALNAMFGWAPQLWENRTWKESEIPGIGKSPRQMAQTLGTEWGRQMVNADLWLILARQQCYAARAAGLPGIVFTDCRFVNEAQLVRELGGLVIRLERASCTPVAGHVSETPIPHEFVSYIVHNDSTLESLYTSLRLIVEVGFGAELHPVPSGTVDESLQRCGHMSRTKRVCTEAAGHRLRHNDGVALWDTGE